MSTIARPFGMFLMFLYELVGNYGLALLLFAIVVKVVMLPFQMKGKIGMMRQTRLQPKVAELQKRHGTNKAKINEEMAKLYKEEGVNPASGCLWSFLRLPIMFALFMVIRQPLTMMMGVDPGYLEACVGEMKDAVFVCEQAGGLLAHRLHELGHSVSTTALYAQVDQARFISAHFPDFARLGIDNLREISFSIGRLNLAEVPQWTFLWSTEWSDIDIWLPGLLLFFVPLVSGGSQFIASAINRKVTPTPAAAEGAGKSMQTMMMLMPLMSVYFGFILPGALGFYWTIGTALQIFQDLWLTKKYTKVLDAEDEEKNKMRKAKDEEIEAKRLETERKKAEGIVERNPNTSKRKMQKNEKQEQIEKTAEWEKKNAPPAIVKNEPGRIGERRYARGRAYDADRFSSSPQNTETIDDESEEALDTSETNDNMILDEIEELEDSETGDDEQEEYLDTSETGDNTHADELEELDNSEFDDDDDDDYDDAPPTVQLDTMRIDSEEDQRE